MAQPKSTDIDASDSSESHTSTGSSIEIIEKNSSSSTSSFEHINCSRSSGTSSSSWQLLGEDFENTNRSSSSSSSDDSVDQAVTFKKMTDASSTSSSDDNIVHINDENISLPLEHLNLRAVKETSFKDIVNLINKKKGNTPEEIALASKLENVLRRFYFSDFIPLEVMGDCLDAFTARLDSL